VCNRGGKTDDANGNLNRIEQGSLVCKIMYSMKLLQHENLVMRVPVVQNDS